MAKIYWRTIKRGKRTFNDVPKELKKAVKALAKEEVKAKLLSKEEYFKLIGENY